MSDGDLTLTIPPALVETIASRATELVLAQLSSRDDHGGYMSVETASEYLDVSVERLRKLQARGAVPYFQEAPGCRVLFRRADLDEWMDGYRHAATGGGA